MTLVASLSPNDKKYGAFYTAQDVATFLVRWAVRFPSERVLDPSFGGGVFLEACCQRIARLGGLPEETVFGAEVDPSAYRQTLTAIEHEYDVPGDHLILGDFFAIRSGAFAVDAVVGNPPFIRYQRFIGDSRRRAIRVAADAGVQLSELCSSWAPFVVHSANMLKEHGRLGFVLPAEIMHASYARPVLEFLTRAFSSITFLTFRRRLFPEISQDTLLLLAEDKGGASSKRVKIREVNCAASLENIRTDDGRSVARRNLALEEVISGSDRFVKHVLPKSACELYDELARHPKVRRLGEIADVGIGYVTGGNAFFHLSKAEAAQWGIPGRFLRRAVCRGRALSGLAFSVKDWEIAEAKGDAAMLLDTSPDVDSTEKGLREYIAHGVSQNVHATFKCRTRAPWYRVPHVHVPDAFLAYMAGAFPRMVLNEVGAVAPNTLHLVRMYPLACVSPDQLVIGWQSSLTRLSAEIEGHAMGGGMLKIEPSEAESILVATPSASTETLRMHVRTLDTLARAGRENVAQATVDAMVLGESLGLGKSDLALLRRATDILRTRRMPKTGPARGDLP